MYDVLAFGKYVGCRIDSMLQHDLGYLQYLKHNKIVQFDTAVLDAMENAFTLQNAVVAKKPYYRDSFDVINGQDMAMYEDDHDNWMDDVPF